MKNTDSQKLKNNRYIAKAFIPFVAVLLLQVATVAILEAFSAGEEGVFAVNGIVLPVLLIPLLMYIYRKNYQLPEEDRVAADVVIKGTLLGFLAVYFIVIAIGNIGDIFFEAFDFSIEASGSSSSKYSGLTGLVLAFLGTVISGPILEEYLFRGLMFESLNRRFGFLPAAIVSSLIFALMHMDMTAVFAFFGVGMVLAYVYNTFRSIGICAGIHMINNAVAFMVMLSIDEPQDVESAEFSYVDTIILSVVSVIILVFIFRKINALKSEV